MYKSQHKWIIDLNVRAETIRLIEETENVWDPEFDKDFFNRTQKGTIIREKNQKLNFIEIENFHPSKDTD